MPRRFDFGFATGLMFKDVKLCLDEAEAQQVPMWVGSAVRQLWQYASQSLGPDSRLHRDRQMHRGLGGRRGRRQSLMSYACRYEIYAIRYARHDRPARENFLGGDPHDGPMPLDYFVWAIIGEGRTFVVDTGFGAAEAKARKRELLRSPGDGLRADRHRSRRASRT